MAELAGFGSLGREGGLSAERPVLVDRFLEDAIEVDVDAIRDATGEVVIGAVMEHVEEAGVHSGDSACVDPAADAVAAAVIAVIEAHTRAIADALDVAAWSTCQYARARPTQVFVIEANPRASRTVPFVSKATGVPLAQVAARVMAGATLADAARRGPAAAAGRRGGHVSVKEAVLPFDRFPDADTLLGPEMRSTGEVMGIDATFGLAFAKSQTAAGDTLPESGRCFCPWPTGTRRRGLRAALRFVELGFIIAATAGTAAYLRGPRRAGGDGRGQGGRGAAPAARRGRRGADPVGQGAAGRQHPPGSWSPRPTAPTSAGRPTSPGGLPHHGGRGPGRGGRHRRLGRAPPRRFAASRSTRPMASNASTCDWPRLPPAGTGSGEQALARPDLTAGWGR